MTPGRTAAASPAPLTADEPDHGRGPRLAVVAHEPDLRDARDLAVAGDGAGRDPWPAAGHGTLRGRHRERQQLDDLLAALRAGRGQVLVARGAAGAGKTALLDDLAERAAGCRVIRVTGVPTETRLPYAGLHQLCLPALDRLARLPATHAEALQSALGLRGASVPSPLLVGLGLLSLLADLAGERPLLCLIDDAHWLDRASAQALGVAVRRMGAQPIAAVVAVREPCDDEDLGSLPTMRVAGLDDADAGAVLRGAVASPLDDRVHARIVAEARGNPGALLDALRDVGADAAAGGLGLSLAAPIEGRATEDALRQVDRLPVATRRLLLIAALEPFGHPAVVLRAARGAGVDAAAAGAAVEAGLLAIDGLVRFRDPHLRRVVHAAATPQQRRDAHHALAAGADAVMDAESTVWHRGHATAWPDEAVATTLEAAAVRALSRAGTAVAAALIQRAVDLTPAAPERARRALTAAEITHEAGAEEASMRLLALAEAGPLDDESRTRAQAVRGRITHSTTQGAESVAPLLDAAGKMRLSDGPNAADGYREAFLAALSTGALARERTIFDVAAAIDRAPLGDDLLKGAGLLAVEGYGAAAPALRRALTAVAADASPAALRLGCVAARALADDAAWDRQTTLLLRRAHQTGATAAMPMALAERLTYELLSGQLHTALELVDQLTASITAARSRSSLDRSVWLTAWRGRHEEAVALIESRRADAIDRGHGQWLVATDFLAALACNGAGRYEEALLYASRAGGHPHDIGIACWTLPEAVEAAVRGGDVDRARQPARELAAIAAASGTDWALGLAARCAALLDQGDGAEERYREAIALLSRTRIRSALARTHLVYGEWLRRRQRRVDAREQLRAAHEMLAAMGADAFADRARRELIATGETVRRRSPDALDDLTPQETEIAQLAASGQTNREIGTQLFLSPRTVEWHLRKVFGKLGVSSRKELSGVLAGAAAR
ncbi:MAG TPA: AAA family ATPase [Baekduia sp.]